MINLRSIKQTFSRHRSRSGIVSFNKSTSRYFAWSRSFYWSMSVSGSMSGDKSWYWSRSGSMCKFLSWSRAK